MDQDPRQTETPQTPDTAKKQRWKKRLIVAAVVLAVLAALVHFVVKPALIAYVNDLLKYTFPGCF